MSVFATHPQLGARAGVASPIFLNDVSGTSETNTVDGGAIPSEEPRGKLLGLDSPAAYWTTQIQDGAKHGKPSTLTTPQLLSSARRRSTYSYAPFCIAWAPMLVRSSMHSCWSNSHPPLTKRPFLASRPNSSTPQTSCLNAHASINGFNCLNEASTITAPSSAD